MARLTDDFGNPSRAAAIEKLPVSPTATNTATSSRSAVVPIVEQSNQDTSIVLRPERQHLSPMTQLQWKIDETHSGIHFSVRHMVVAKVRGAFNRWDATLELD